MSQNKIEKLDQFLSKTKHYDADERYMAVSDLVKQLDQINGQIDVSQQTSIRNRILELLDDKSSDVSTIAVKGLSSMVQKFSPEENVTIVKSLGELVVDPRKASQIDTRADGLKTIISSLRPEDGKEVATKLTSNLTSGLRTISSSDFEDAEDEIRVKMVLLDVLRDILARYGSELEEKSTSEVTEVLIPLLEHENTDLRKTANITLGAVVPSLPDADFNQLMNKIIAEIKGASKESPKLFTYIQTVGVVSTHAAPRVGPHLKEIIPQLLEFSAYPSDDSECAETQLSLWENCLQAFESIITKCPQEVDSYVKELVEDRALRYISYDPFVADEVQADEDMGGDDDFGDADFGDDAGGWGDDDDAGFGDDAGGGGAVGGWGDDAAGAQVAHNDDDTSWRIRRAAVGVITAFVHARSDILKDSYPLMLDVVIKRFAERESSVREEVLNCCAQLIGAAGVSNKEPDERMDSALNVPKLVRLRSFVPPLQNEELIGRIVNGCHKQFKEGQVNIKQAVLGVLRELVIVKANSKGKAVLDEHLEQAFAVISAGIRHKDVSLKGDSLKLLNVFLDLHSTSAVEKYIEELAMAVVESIATDQHPKTLADALRVVGSIVQHADAHRNIVGELYNAVYKQLQVSDTDETVKQTSIKSTSILVSVFGDELKAEQDQAIDVLQQRLQNDVTRIPALDGFTRMASSELGRSGKINLKPLLTTQSIKELVAFLRKDKMELRHSAARCLGALVRCGGGTIKKAAYTHLLEHAAPHISDKDLQLSRHILDMFSSMIETYKSAPKEIAKSKLPDLILTFTCSPLLQGQALVSLQRFYEVVVSHGGAGPLTYDQIVKHLMNSVGDETDEPSLRAIASCIASMTNTLDQSAANDSLASYEQQIKGKKTAHPARALALMILGQVGRTRDLGDEHKNVDQVALSAFKSSSTIVKTAAAYALGNIACGNLDRYLPSLLDNISNQADIRYLLLSSLKEIITVHSQDEDKSKEFYPRVEKLMGFLLKYASSSDEFVREMVAECLGVSAIIDPVVVYPILQENCKHKDALLRNVTISSVRSALGPGYSVAISQYLDDFMELLNDKDIAVRRQAIITVNALARANVGVIADLLPSTILPALYRETEFNKDLIEEKDFGAFKEVIDHGLTLRKAAFQALQTVLEVAPYKLKPLSTFISQIQKGLVDPNQDIQLLALKMTVTLAEARPNDLLETLDSFPKPLTVGIKPKLKRVSKKGPDGEKAREGCRAIVRTMFRIMELPGVQMKPAFVKFFKQIKVTKSIKSIVESVTKEFESK